MTWNAPLWFGVLTILILGLFAAFAIAEHCLTRSTGRSRYDASRYWSTPRRRTATRSSGRTGRS